MMRSMPPSWANNAGERRRVLMGENAKCQTPGSKQTSERKLEYLLLFWFGGCLAFGPWSLAFAGLCRSPVRERHQHGEGPDARPRSGVAAQLVIFPQARGLAGLEPRAVREGGARKSLVEERAQLDAHPTGEGQGEALLAPVADGG